MGCMRNVNEVFGCKGNVIPEYTPRTHDTVIVVRELFRIKMIIVDSGGVQIHG